MRISAFGDWRGVLFAAVSIGGVLNALPFQDHVYRFSSKETEKVGFIRGQDPIFAAYRYLARAPGVLGVWQVDRPYYNLPGYYYLHREIPFYDVYSGRSINKGLEITAASVSHIVSENTELVIPAIRWRSNLAIFRSGAETRIMRRSVNGRRTIRSMSAMWNRLWRALIPMRQNPHPITVSASRLRAGKLLLFFPLYSLYSLIIHRDEASMGQVPVIAGCF